MIKVELVEVHADNQVAQCLWLKGGYCRVHKFSEKKKTTKLRQLYEDAKLNSQLHAEELTNIHALCYLQPSGKMQMSKITCTFMFNNELNAFVHGKKPSICCLKHAVFPNFILFFLIF